MFKSSQSYLEHKKPFSSEEPEGGLVGEAEVIKPRSLYRVVILNTVAACSLEFVDGILR